MPGPLRFAVPVLASGLAIVAVYLAWPSSQILAPEKTGEIGFMGIVVIVKYVSYGTRIMGAFTLGAATLFAVIASSRRLRAVLTETPEDTEQ